MRELRQAGGARVTCAVAYKDVQTDQYYHIILCKKPKYNRITEKQYIWCEWTDQITWTAGWRNWRFVSVHTFQLHLEQNHDLSHFFLGFLEDKIQWIVSIIVNFGMVEMWIGLLYSRVGCALVMEKIWDGSRNYISMLLHTLAKVLCSLAVRLGKLEELEERATPWENKGN